MLLRPIHANLGASLEDFLANPSEIIGEAGSRTVAIMSQNRVVFYVNASDLIGANVINGKTEIAHPQSATLSEKPEKNQISIIDRFEWLAGELVSVENQVPNVVN